MKTIKEIINNAKLYFSSQEFKNILSSNKNLERTRKEFINRFNVQYIKSMELNDYAIGILNKRDTFCYIFEYKLRGLGSNKGANASKYGVWVDQKTQKPRKADKWGKDLNPYEAFKVIKTNIIELLENGKMHNFETLESSKIANTTKGKILYIYYPDDFIPIYSEKQLNFFLNFFNIDCNEDTTGLIEKNQLLLDYKRTTDPFKNHSNLEFMNFLYSNLGFKKETDRLKNRVDYNYNGKINTPHFSKVKKKDKRSGEGYDYAKALKQKMIIGLKAEKFVTKYEKTHHKKYKDKIKWVGNKTNKYNYDVLSVEDDGKTPKHIEVKTKSDAKYGDIDFYLTCNEKYGLEHDKYYVIYFVSDIKTKKPCIQRINKNNIKELSEEIILYRYKGGVK